MAYPSVNDMSYLNKPPTLSPMLRPEAHKHSLTVFHSTSPHCVAAGAPAHPNLRPIKMSSQSQIIEHLVLFKVKEEAHPSKINAWLEVLNGLTSLNEVLHLTACPVLRTRSSSSLSFTHVVHGRYASQDDLAAYNAHPRHVSAIRDHREPLVEDILAVDWVFVADDLHLAPPPPGSAVRISVLKLKENLTDEAKAAVLVAVRGIKDRFREVTQFTFGENFSPGGDKGFSVAWLSVFPGQSELEAAGSNHDSGILEEKISAFVEADLVVDFVVPTPNSASV